MTWEEVERMRAICAANPRAFDTAAWADRFAVSRETIRKALRGETYRQAPGIPPVQFDALPGQERGEEEIAASLEKVNAMLASTAPPDSAKLIEEMMGRDKIKPATRPEDPGPATPPKSPLDE